MVTVPHLIVNVDPDSGLAVQTEEVRVGRRLSVLAFPAPPELLRPEALKVFGPPAFGYEHLEEPII